MDTNSRELPNHNAAQARRTTFVHPPGQAQSAWLAAALVRGGGWETDGAGRKRLIGSVRTAGRLDVRHVRHSRVESTQGRVECEQVFVGVRVVTSARFSLLERVCGLWGFGALLIVDGGSLLGA